MILYRYHQPGRRRASYAAGTEHGLVDVAAESWVDLLADPDLPGRVRAALDAHPRVHLTWDELAPAPDPVRPHLLPPVEDLEVWGAGVTYQVSRYERMRESETAADVYARVYEAERPELFLKATAARAAGPGAPIRVRADSGWTVPEPELTLVCAPDLRVAGYTVGNDVSARDIEGQNPLYLPQAKIYHGSCALGPGLIVAGDGYEPLAQTIACRIVRDGAELWADTAPTAQLKRGLEELVRWLGREQRFPCGVALMTGTCLVPPEDVSLRAGDVVEIELSGLGVLRNPVGD